jgi:hypothetical protein
LSLSDIESIRPIALLNITVLFDEHDLNFTRKKSKKKTKGEFFGYTKSSRFEFMAF